MYVNKKVIFKVVFMLALAVGMIFYSIYLPQIYCDSSWSELNSKIESYEIVHKTNTQKVCLSNLSTSTDVYSSIETGATISSETEYESYRMLVKIRNNMQIQIAIMVVIYLVFCYLSFSNNIVYKLKDKNNMEAEHEN